MAASLIPRSVRVIDVSARDGLQNVKQRVTTRHKVDLILLLSAVGFRDIELRSAVSPKAIPQLADCQDVLSDIRIQGLMQDTAVRAITLVPNARRLDVVRKNKGRAVAVFVSASEGFSQANIQCDVETGLQRAAQVTLQARADGLLTNPFLNASTVCLKLVATRSAWVTQLESAKVWAAMGKGLSAFDSSVAGLGGCPYAPGAKGNVASEDLIYSLHKAGIATGVDYDAIVEVGRFVDTNLGLGNYSRAGTANLSSLAPRANSAKRLHWSVDLLTDELEVHRNGRNLRSP
ncbi:hypothetical protein LTR37_001673 [Vermiconidia calcicola]|uniref:Uncharacterized protein n=1 Tax=Vermiconidia calcicola TaxID=1690605 RepID=A0ACC3NUF8_9PEZI|nr:hypothetical protein LTR37_001673 [Vermiconidia calcicola]